MYHQKYSGNNSRKKEGKEPKQKQHPVVDVTGDRSKVRCCKEQYCIGTWNVRPMNQGKFSSVQFSSVAQSCPTPCNPMNHNTKAFNLPEGNLKTFIHLQIQFSSVQFSRSVVSYSLRPQGLQHARPPCPSPTPEDFPNSRPLSR